MDTQQSYGHERLHQYLISQGHNISPYIVRQIKQENGIYCKRHKRFKTTTDSNHNKPVYPNLLEQQFDVTAPNIAWASDITYIWTNEDTISPSLCQVKPLTEFHLALVGSLVLNHTKTDLNQFTHTRT